MTPIRFAVGRMATGLEATGLAPAIARTGAWRAVLAGAVAYLAWQVAVAVTAIVAYLHRVRGTACPLGPLCSATDGWSDARVAAAALLALSLSLVVLVTLARIALALWRRRFWAGFAMRIAGWATVIGGALLILLGGLPWLLLGGWLVYWSGRLQYDPPPWATPPGPPPGAPADPMVIEGERVDTP